MTTAQAGQPAQMTEQTIGQPPSYPIAPWLVPAITMPIALIAVALIRRRRRKKTCE